MEKHEENYCTLYLVRHGETEWNTQDIIQGKFSDSPLTECGVRQAEELRAKLNNVNFDAVYSSDLLRAKRTAQIIALEKQLAVTTSNLLRERSYGKFEGKSISEYRAGIKHLLEKFNKLSDEERITFKFAEDIESNDELISRFITFLREVAISHLGQTVLIITHGGCLKTFLIHTGFVAANEIPLKACANCCYAKVSSDGLEFNVLEIEGIKILKSSGQNV